MSHRLETVLETRCRENPDFTVMRAQWDFDKRLLSAALQAVGHSFPHYSRHDASHSHAILIQVERFLGTVALEKLSATDIWLLLEAAYYHDSGMIVTNAQLEQVWSQPDFQSYVKALGASSDPDLAEASQWLLGRPPQDSGRNTNAAPLVDARWPLRVVRCVRLVVAEYRRRDHSSLSEDVVHAPDGTGITSPRTGLIPDRLFGMLGRICLAHGKTFDEVLELPYCESGVAQDLAHPRFIACLLRLGDLLDLDNGRFCPTMLACAGPLPQSSQAHIAKHASIRHLRIDPEVIEVEAEFSSDDAITEGYQACTAWFDMLRDELGRQQARWTQIAPGGFGPLPSAGKIEVRVRNLVSFGRLEIDVQKVTKLLQGANLYKDTSTFIRELLQNAVDATLLRLWLEKKPELEKAKAVGQTDLARHLLEQWPIEVNFKRVGKAVTDGRQHWHLTVTDLGAGISRNDIEHIRNVGSSATNPHRCKIIESMPEWLRPSGAFGIGLQSLFLVTDAVRINTRAVDTGQSLQIRLLRGTDNLRPTILVETCAEAADRPFGTTVECDLQLEALPDRLLWGSGRSKKDRIIRDFDGLVDRDMPVAAAEIEERLVEYGMGSWVRIRFNGQDVATNTPTSADWRFDEEASVRVRLELNNSVDGWIRYYYRGALLDEDRRQGWPFLGVTVDILASTSDRILTLDRGKFREDCKHQTTRRIHEAIERSILARHTTPSSQGDAIEKSRLSFAALVSTSKSVSSLAGGEWGKVAFATTGHMLEYIVTYSTVEVSTQNVAAGIGLRVEGEENWGLLRISGSGSESDSWMRLLQLLLHRQFPYQQLREIESIVNSDNHRPRKVAWGKQPFDDVIASDELFRAILTQSRGRWMAGARRALPCRTRFACLALRDDSALPWVVRIEPDIGPQMLSPFTIFHDERIDVTAVRQLVEFVAENARQVTTKPAVAKAYADFVEYVDDLMAGDPDWKKNKRYCREAALADFLRGGQG